LRRRSSAAAAEADWLWALRDVSFDVGEGEILGVLGKNGSGKSTLLKILSRITEPSRGRAEIYGRVASLLEVGTGFHPELTGRENTYLNGAILGMRKTEIERKFDEIVAFAEIEKFIDTPVKFYSSGMYLRLAFAVAAHLEPEILIVDEVLAVGDGRFQKNCLSKMQDVGQEGRTVLFVSHSMPAITRLCKRALLLDQGRVAADGPVHQVVASYLNSNLGSSAEREWDEITAPRGRATRLRAARVRNERGEVSQAIDIRQPFQVEMEFDVTRPDALILPHFHFFNEEDVHLFCSLDSDEEWRRRPRQPGRYVSRAWVPGNLLAEGTFFLHFSMVSLKDNGAEFAAPNAVTIQIIDSLEGDSARVDWPAALPGVMRPLLRWTTDYTPLEEARHYQQ
jgi:lipopolysaccharide transport system ATP-binding protein